MFKTIFLLTVLVCSITTTMADATQVPLSTPVPERVDGNNVNATYCTVPRSEQLFKIEFFEIAPTPMPVDEIFFTYLRGRLENDVTGLENAKLRITMSAELEKGGSSSPKSFTIPLASCSRELLAHITIRYPGNEFGGPLRPGVNEILTDYWFPGFALETGQWTFKIEAFLPGEEEEVDKYLFAFQLSQWMKGHGWF